MDQLERCGKLLDEISEALNCDLLDDEKVTEMYLDLAGQYYLCLDSDQFPYKSLKSFENTSKIIGSKDQDLASELFNKIIQAPQWFYLREPERQIRIIRACFPLVSLQKISEELLEVFLLKVQKIVFFMSQIEKNKSLKLLGLSTQKRFLFDNFEEPLNSDSIMATYMLRVKLGINMTQ